MQLEIQTSSFDSGFREDYKGYHIDPILLSDTKLTSPICIKLQKYNTPSCKNLMNISTLALEMHDTILYLNSKIEKIYQRMNKIRCTGFIDDLCELNYEKEIVIHIIKRYIDDLIMILYLYYANESVEKNKKIEISSIGHIMNKASITCEKIKKELNYDKHKIFLTVINDLHNAYKHSCLKHLSDTTLPAEGEAYFLLYAKNNNLNDVYYLWHNMMHIVIGFSDFLLDFFIESSDIDRQQVLLSQKKYLHLQ